MSYGLLGLQQNMEGRAMQGMQHAADIQRQNRMTNEQLKQAERQQTMNNIGTGAGIGMMAGGPAGAAIGAGTGFLVSSIF